MVFIKDWEIWFNYKNNVEKIRKSDKISKLDSRQKFIPKCNKKSFLTTQSFQNKKVITLDKSEMKKFKSERYIDLHGYKRDIDTVLENFCTNCILKNYKFVTIITGKGNGIIKEATENWILRHPEFIIAFSGIKDSMQQVGAYAIKLRIKNNNLN